MAAALRLQLTRHAEGGAPPAPRPEIVAAFEYAQLAHQLADVFDVTLGGTEQRDAEASAQ